MMQPEESFRARAIEVRAYLRSLQNLEKSIATPGRGFYRAAATITASRAAVFIMIYNCVEFSVREALADLRRQIASECSGIAELGEFWQEDLIRGKLYDKLRQGTNHARHMKDIVLLLNSSIDWGGSEHELTFAGNIDHKQLFQLAQALGCKWSAPKGTLGGSDLQVVRQKRNDLAHGQDSFLSVGNNFDTNTMIQQFDRIRKFIVSFLKMLERYRVNKRYLRCS